MTDKAEIDKAIGAHGAWKVHLRTAIDTGKSETPVETIRTDNQCAFGKWLHGPTLTAADRTSNHYKTIKELHATFHKTAARVTELALAGNKTEAEKMMAPTGEFTTASAKLTGAMMEWKKSLG